MNMYVAMQDALLIAHGQRDDWQLNVALDRLPIVCLTFDPYNPERLYCGTFGQGLWRSDDAGKSWQPVGEGITYAEITAVAVSQSDKQGRFGTVWAGTEPSALFCSFDGGDTWHERPALLDLPSRETWMFPPRPYTHHVRWIQPDIFEQERLFVAIEMGGVMRSVDRGLTWEDRKPGSQLDGHTLRMHSASPGRVYEAAGGEDPEFHYTGPLGEYVTLKSGGFAETRDGGVTWETIETGLEQHHYLWSLAIDPADPDTMIASAAAGAAHAHQIAMAETYLYRRTASTAWHRVHQGFSQPHGTLISEIAVNASEPGVFYAANNHGIYRSSDTGQSWQHLPLEIPARFHKQHVQSLVVTAI
jgi:photosystem II stability/assembly factor-like uncharacterized protein